MDDPPHVVRLEEFVQRFAVEKRRALVTEFRKLQFEAVDLARLAEDLPDANVSTVASRDDLPSERIENSLELASTADDGFEKRIQVDFARSQRSREFDP